MTNHTRVEERLVFLTGISGAGKSAAMHCLEDMGFYCSDNLPVALIEPFLEEVALHENATRVGIVVDVRTHDFATIFPTFYQERLKKLVPHVVLIFLEATDEVLALLDVMIAVGGITDFADGNAASILRGSEGNKQYNVRIKDLLNRGDVSANVEMKPGDVLIIPQSWF